tara:strand:+ start:176 stop:559 length:384 start_codon:yes stop_codon:yes gene_type:complete
MTKNFIRSTDQFNYDRMDCPERRLFVAILSQAVHDAFIGHATGLEMQAARSFLTSNSEHFRFICEMAGKNSTYVSQKIKKRILKAKGWNVDISMGTYRRKRKRNPNQLTGNSYYAAKKKLHQATSVH